jgi:hypothetical protein
MSTLGFGSVVRRVFAIGALLTATALPAASQGLLNADDPRHAEILSVVTRLFDGMRTSDTAMARTLFHPDAQLLTTTMRDGQPSVSRDSVAAFLRSIGTVRAEKLDERIKNPRVLLDGTLAVVWVDYDLFVGTRFIHCGVDAFQIAKVGASWQIVSLADTRRREGCSPPPAN